MIKYITLIDDLKEMMVMFNSLPTISVVFDESGVIVDLNALAIRYFKVDDKEKFLTDNSKLTLNYDNVLNAIAELRTGKPIQNFKIRIVDSDTTLMYNATMLTGDKRYFLFQFIEIETNFNHELLLTELQNTLKQIDLTKQQLELLKNTII